MFEKLIGWGTAIDLYAGRQLHEALTEVLGRDRAGCEDGAGSADRLVSAISEQQESCFAPGT